MSNNDDLSTNDLDDELAEAIQLLRRVEPRAASRARNRTVIALELERMKKSVATRAWWNRSVVVPVPVVLGICAAFLIMITWLPSWGVDSRKGNSIAAPSVDEGRDSIENEQIIFARQEDQTQRMEHEASETYLCGIGRVEYESIYHLRED